MNDLENSFVDFMTNFYIYDSSPVVVLFGPRTSGKTMALIRLTLFLEKEGYRVVPEKSFRLPHDTFYNDICEAYPKKCYDKYASHSTNYILLVKVLDRQGRTVCQLLDAPGNFYFDRCVPEEMWLEPYFDRIFSLPNQRVWLFFVEPGWGDDCKTRELYVKRIRRVSQLIHRGDETVFVFNKIDKDECLFSIKGEVDMLLLYKMIRNNYPNIFEPFSNKPPKRWFREYNCRFVPFSSGTFFLTSDGRQVYNSSNDFFPKSLWKAICASIK